MPRPTTNNMRLPDGYKEYTHKNEDNAIHIRDKDDLHVAWVIFRPHYGCYRACIRHPQPNIQNFDTADAAYRWVEAMLLLGDE